MRISVTGKELREEYEAATARRNAGTHC